MLEILPAPDHVGAYKLSGTLIEEDFDQVVADLERRLSRHDKISVLADITGLHDVTVRTGIKDLRYSFGKIFEWNRFPKEAVITDKAWIKTLVQLVGPLVPFVSVRTFDPGEMEAALAWAADIPTTPKVNAATETDSATP
jgi:hypothetical protein